MAASGDYYINLVTGTIQQQHNSLLAPALIAAGYWGPFNTIAEAKAYYNSHNINPAKNISSAAEAVPHFLGRLINPHTWLRVAEVVIGLILLAVGLNALLKQSTGIDVVGSAVKTAAVVK